MMPFFSPPVRWRLLAGLLLPLVAAVLYCATLYAPWYHDDFQNIVDNHLIRHPSTALRFLFERRGLAQFTFALNYYFSGLSLPGYHLVNIALHLACAWLVFQLLRRVFPGRDGAALFGAMVFLVHPLQTQAVNYVVQRMAGLCAFLFLLAMYLFVLARERLAAGNSFISRGHLRCYLGALVAGALALLSKENALVLPVALALFGHYFLPGDGRWRAFLPYLAPFALAPLLFFIWHLLLPVLWGSSLAQLAATDQQVNPRGESPIYYLFTQFSVLWIYLRMLVVPYGQTLDHCYPVVTDLLTLKNLIAAGGLGLLGWLGWHLRRRMPYLSFAIVWFFLTLAVESSIIPLDPLMEQRLYLPMFGFAVAVTGLGIHLPGQGLRQALAVVLLSALALLAWQRNRLWSDPVAFYKDNLRKVPHSERTMVNLASYITDLGRHDEAERLLRQALSLNQARPESYVNLGRVLTSRGRLDEAVAALQEGLRRYPDAERLHHNLGYIYLQQEDYAQAFAHLRRAVEINPFFLPSVEILGRTCADLGRWPEAETWARRAIELEPEKADASYNLGVALYNQGRMIEARAAFAEALRLAPEHAGALYNATVVALETGDAAAARALLGRLGRVDPAGAATLATGLESMVK